MKGNEGEGRFKAIRAES